MAVPGEGPFVAKTAYEQAFAARLATSGLRARIDDFLAARGLKPSAPAFFPPGGVLTNLQVFSYETRKDSPHHATHEGLRAAFLWLHHTRGYLVDAATAPAFLGKVLGRAGMAGVTNTGAITDVFLHKEHGTLPPNKLFHGPAAGQGWGDFENRVEFNPAEYAEYRVLQIEYFQALIRYIRDQNATLGVHLPEGSMPVLSWGAPATTELDALEVFAPQQRHVASHPSHVAGSFGGVYTIPWELTLDGINGFVRAVRPGLELADAAAVGNGQPSALAALGVVPAPNVMVKSLNACSGNMRLEAAVAEARPPPAVPVSPKSANS